MKRYRLDLAPVYRRGNKQAYEYSATITEFDDSEGSETTVWKTIEIKRRDAKALGEGALIEFKQAARVVIRPLKAKEVFRGQRVSVGMSGKRHTKDALRKLSEAMKARWAAGEFKNVKMGRLTNVERAVRKRKAAEHESAVQHELRERRRVERLGVLPSPSPLIRPRRTRGPGKPKLK